MNNFILKENKIVLKEYNDAYYNETFTLFSLYEGKELVRNDDNSFHRLNFYSEFKRNIKKRYFDFFLFQTIDKNEIIGFIYCYNYDQKNQNIFFEIFLNSPDYYENNDLRQLVQTYLNRIISNKKIRILYSHCLSYENKKFKFFKCCNFVTIGTMKEYRYYKKKYIDVKILELI